MESYQPPLHGYMRPPPAPPSMVSDPNYPHHQHHHQQYPPPPPPPPQQSTTSSWYPGQFQYHPSHSPSPPPPQPQQNQWGPPPPPPPPAYAPHPHQPYSAPQSYPPPPPPPPSSYPNQEWGNGNWTHHSGWEYPPAHSNEEDWAAKAKAWASSRPAMENQQPQPQYTSASRQEDPSPYGNQYSQPLESHYQDVQQTSVPTPGFPSYQGPVAPLHRPPAVHQQEPAAVSSYNSEPNFSFAAKDGALRGDMGAGFAHHQGQTSSSDHQQEVPSSYSSIPGYENGLRGNQYGNSLLPADGRVMPSDHAQFGYGNHPANPMDQPLEFASRFSHDNDPKMMSNYPDPSGPVRGTDSVAAVSSLHSWTAPAAPGASYPPIAPTFPGAFQHDPVGVPPLPGQHSPLFGIGPGFQSPVPSITAPIGLSSGAALHPAAAFPIDAYGVPLGSERPKKAAVPNWLREEIIKTKATIASSGTDHFKEESQSVEDELIDKPLGKADQDSKSIDSARSTEEEDDEDDVDALRTAAINQEIKRVLTEVLLKVTDELFDEIATKVLSEDDLTANVVAGSDIHVTVPGVSPPPPVLTPKVPAKVNVPVKAKESEERASLESSSGSPGNVLGLANYASDEDDEIQASSAPTPDGSGVRGARENGRIKLEAEDHRKNQVNKDVDTSNVSRTYPGSTVIVDEKGDGVGGDAPKSNYNDHKETSDGQDVHVDKKGDRRHGRQESKSRSSGRDNYKETESRREREAEKDEIYGRRDERHQKKDRTEDSKREREKGRRERSPRHGEKARESDSRKRSPHHEVKDSKVEREKDKKRSGKDDGDKKRERAKEEKNDKSRHKSSDGGRHKRRRSSSVGSRGKPIKESPVLSDGSSDEASGDSRRKDNSKRRNLSPSPTRSRRRQVSRSPHSKHTQQRHSPYSSLDGSRERKSRSRSRSKSPSRKHRR